MVLTSHLLHLFGCHLSIVLALRIRIFVYNGRDDVELPSHGTRAMVFDANATLLLVGVDVRENITWIDHIGACRNPTPCGSSNLLGSNQRLRATSG